MRFKLLLMIAIAYVVGAVLISCDSKAEKAADAREAAQVSKENQEDAQYRLNKAVQDSILEYQRFRTESNDRIIAYEKQIQEIKIKVAKENGTRKTAYQKTIIKLENNIVKLKKDLSDYKDDGKYQWEVFKNEFGKDINDLGSSIENFFTKDNE